MTKDTTLTAPSTMKIMVVAPPNGNIFTVAAKRFRCAEVLPTEVSPSQLYSRSTSASSVQIGSFLCRCDFDVPCDCRQRSAAYCLFTSKVGSTDQFDWFMDYFVGLFTSSLVSYTEKLRSMNSPVMHGAVPTQYELLLPFAFPAPTKSLRGFEEDSRSEVNLAFSTGTVISMFVPTVHAFDYMQKSSRNVYC